MAAGIIAIALGAILVYLPALDGEFIVDDDAYVTNYPLIHAPDGLTRIWFTTEALDPWPVTYTSFWLEWRLWGMTSTGYHATNVVLHVICCLMIWAVLRKLSIPGAWLAAMLFAVHPVNVESVAWIAQRKGVLCLFFILLTICWYLKSNQPRDESSSDHATGKSGWFWLSLLAYQLAMLSKATAAGLPLVLLVIVWWQRGRITGSDLVRVSPFFATALLWGLVNVWFVSRHQVLDDIRSDGLLERVLGAAAAVWFYLGKAFAPLNLNFFYPDWRIQSADWRWWLPLIAAITVTALLVWQRNKAWVRPLLFVWAIYWLALLPVLGLVHTGHMRHTLVADHYQHTALVSAVAFVAAALTRWYQSGRKLARPAAAATAVAVIAVLFLLACQQSRLYADRITLYEATVSMNPTTWLIHNNLGNALAARGKLDEGIEHVKTAVQLNPDFAEAHNNLAALLIESGGRDGFRADEIPAAIHHLAIALRLRPKYANARTNMGRALMYARRPAEARIHYQLALDLRPGDPEALYGMGGVLSEEKNWPEAEYFFQQALVANPNSAKAHYALGNALAAQQEYRPAVEHYQQAIKLRPDYSDALQNLGACLIELGQREQALHYLRQALKLRPEDAIARENLEKAMQSDSQPTPGTPGNTTRP